MKSLQWEYIPKVLLVTLLGLLLFGIVGCGARDRINPFDPAASIDSSVFNLRLRSDPSSVFLSWVPVNSTDVRAYNIYRAVVPDSLSLLTQVFATVNSYHDTSNISAGETYAYGVSALGSITETQISRLDTITPGDSWWWAASESNSNAPLSKLSHDGLHVYQSYAQYDSPRYLATEWNSQVLFVYNSSQRGVFMQWRENNIQLLANDIYNIRDMVYNQSGRYLVFTPEHDSSITTVSVPYGGKRQYQITRQALVNAIAVSSNGTSWIAAGDSLFSFRDGNSHFYYTTNGALITAIEPIQDGELMLSLETEQSIQHIVPDPESIRGGILDTSFVNVGAVKQMVYDPAKTILWMRTYDLGNQEYKILQYTSSQIREVLTGGVQMLTMAVNPISHDCLTADYGNGWLYRISPDGTVRKKISPIGPIYELVVQPLSSN